jgi:hypothetical protein
VEYFQQWFENQHVPPLILIAPPNTPIGPITGTPAARVLYGGERVDFGGIDSIRATAGYWLDSQQTWALEASGFITEKIGQDLTVALDGAATNPVLLARTNGTFAIASVVGAPGVSRGSVTVSQTAQLWGSEANVVYTWADRSRWRTELLAGFRYLDLDESLDIGDITQSLADQTTIAHLDTFDSRTQWYGGQVGSKLTGSWGPMSLALIGKIGLGGSHLSVTRSGQTLATPNVTVPADTGILVSPINAGRDSTDRLAVLSETTIQVGWQWTRRLGTTVGYNVLYLSSCARVGDQILGVGGVNATDFWAQGITFGLTYRY